MESGKWKFVIWEFGILGDNLKICEFLELKICEFLESRNLKIRNFVIQESENLGTKEIGNFFKIWDFSFLNLGI